MSNDETAVKLAQKQAAGLRALAGMVEAHPELADELRYALDSILVSVSTADDPAGMIAMFIRVGLAHGAKITKKVGDKHGGAYLTFPGDVVLDVYAPREQVCERVQVGTKKVTKEIPDPSIEVPTVTVTDEEPVYEWHCKPLLANGSGAGSAVTS